MLFKSSWSCCNFLQIFWRPRIFFAAIVALHFTPFSVSVVGWAEFQINIASRLASLFSFKRSKNIFNKKCRTRNLHNLHFPDNTFQGRICLQRQILDFLGPHTHQVWLLSYLFLSIFITMIKFQHNWLKIYIVRYLNFSFTECSSLRLRKYFSFSLMEIYILQFVW